jgi:hypothetical protein
MGFLFQAAHQDCLDAAWNHHFPHWALNFTTFSLSPLFIHYVVGILYCLSISMSLSPCFL